MKNTNLNKHLLYSILATLTLGLAPFGSPHLFGKIKWVMGGAKGMKGMDWFDLVLHGSPFIYLFVTLILFAKIFFKQK